MSDDGLLGLSLGADKKDVSVLLDGLSYELFAYEKALDGLFDIYNVYAIPLAVDIRGHFGVPPAYTVAIMNARIYELTY